MKLLTALLIGLALTAFAATASASESANLESTLVFLIEEEKLANNLYDALHEKFGHRTHGNIKRSESRHMGAIAKLLDTRDIEDPTGKLPKGKFTTAELQKLHDDLLARGTRSLAEALAVGALVEEKDIADLTELIEAKGTPDDVRTVLERLRRASYNHLDGFTSAWENETGKKYEPVLLDAGVYAAARAAGAKHHREMRGNGRHGKKGKGRSNGMGRGKGAKDSCQH
jgi:hypothetical protein